jgi:hypothetical protein
MIYDRMMDAARKPMAWHFQLGRTGAVATLDVIAAARAVNAEARAVDTRDLDSQR